MIELMMAVSLSALLLTLAVPTYNNFVTRTRRAEARATLIGIQSMQERHRLSKPTYATLEQLGVTTRSARGYYDVAIKDVSASTYTVTATVVAGSPQATDKACPVISLTQDGPDRRTPAQAECWDR